MKKSLRETKREADRQRSERQYKRDGENRIVVHMTVKNDDDFLSAFSVNETPVISSEVADFIENSTNWIPPKEPLTLKICSSCIDHQEQAIYKKAINEYYIQRYIANERELKRNRIIAVLLALAGILVLVWEILFDSRTGNMIWTEVIDIVAWVLLWESVDITVFGNRSLKMKRWHYLSCLSMKVEYTDNS